MYLAGAKPGMVQVFSDHRSLQGITKKALDSVPTTRLQNMRLKLQIYDFSITYVPAKHVILADVLSRRPYFGDKGTQEEPDNYGCNAITVGCSSITLDHGGDNDGDI